MGETGGTGILIGIAVIYFALFYFMKVRPDRERKKKKQDMKESLVAGDNITMIDGIVGTVCAVKAGTVVVETGADRVRLEYAKWAILEKGINVEGDPDENQA